MKYKTFIEIVTDGESSNEAIDRAGEYLRGTYQSDIPLKVRTQPMGTRNVQVLGYAISICLLALGLSFGWFSAGRSYQHFVSAKETSLGAYAVQPPLATDMRTHSGQKLKKEWDRLYKKKVLYGRDKNIGSK